MNYICKRILATVTKSQPQLLRGKSWRQELTKTTPTENLRKATENHLKSEL